MVHGVLYVVIIGIIMMLVLYVDNLVTHSMVCNVLYNIVFNSLIGALATYGSLLYNEFPISTYGVNCTGNESMIFDCPIHLMNKGKSYVECENNNAGVVCQSKVL